MPFCQIFGSIENWLSWLAIYLLKYYQFLDSWKGGHILKRAPKSVIWEISMNGGAGEELDKRWSRSRNFLGMGKAGAGAELGAQEVAPLRNSLGASPVLPGAGASGGSSLVVLQGPPTYPCKIDHKRKEKIVWVPIWCYQAPGQVPGGAHCTGARRKLESRRNSSPHLRRIFWDGYSENIL